MRCVSVAILANLLGAVAKIPAAEASNLSEQAATAVTRTVSFKLTFAHGDLTWVGDPASPLAQAFVRPGARPLATDAWITTHTTRDEPTMRRVMREARIAPAVGGAAAGAVAGDDEAGSRSVFAFTKLAERAIGVIDAQGRFVPNEFFRTQWALLPTWPSDPAALKYDPRENVLYSTVDAPGPVVSESLDFLPLELLDESGKQAAGAFSIDFTPQAARGGGGNVALCVRNGAQRVELARADLPRSFRREEMRLGSFDNARGQYLAEAAYRPGGGAPEGADPSATVTFAGQFSPGVEASGAALRLTKTSGRDLAAADGRRGTNSPAGEQSAATEAAISNGTSPPIKIDGNFDDWRQIAGIDDPRGDGAPYLEYVPDVDLLELKVASDDERIYLYARVAGQIGRTHPDGGRAYFYAYLDVDRDATTGFVPSRDDDCYYGVDLGDDCEVQFEFVDNAFRKTFYGFCGLGGDDHVLRRQVTLGPSQYGRLDAAGHERAHYKSEYIVRGGATEITEDLKLGTSDTIQLALSPDGSEVEISSTFAGFLHDPQGRPTLAPGQTINLAAGMECDSKAYVGKTRWAADSTRVMRGYKLPDASRGKK